MIASLDLGSLGAKEGPATAYDWTPINPVPRITPWLLVLALLLLKPNRISQAWLIFLPIFWGWSIQALVPLVFSIPSAARPFMVEPINAVVFGLALAALLPAKIHPRHRFLNFLTGLVLVEAGACTTVLLRLVGAVPGDDMAQILIISSLGALVVTASLHLAARFSCKRFSSLRFVFWLVAILAVLWALVSTPFAIADNAPVWELLLAVASTIGVTFALLVGFLVLGKLSPLYAARFRRVFRLDEEPVATRDKSRSPQQPVSLPTR